MIELRHSKELSRRLRIDPEFKELIYRNKKNSIMIDNGITKIREEIDDNSLLSEEEIFDSELEFDLLESQACNAYTKARVAICRKKYNDTRKKKLNDKLKEIKWLRIKYTLVPLSIRREPSPMKSARLFEYTFPLDSSIFNEYQTFVLKDYCYFIDISEYKRVHTAYYDKEAKVFITKLHEKIFKKESYYTNNQQYQYYKEWLSSLNNLKAKYFCDVLNTAAQVKKELHTKQLKMKEGLTNNQNEKIILNSINADLKKKILSLPYYARVTKLEIIPSSEESGLIEEEYSQPFLRLLGYDVKDEGQILNRIVKFLAQKSIYTKYYLDLTISVLNGKNSKNAGLTSHVSCQLIDKYGEDIGEYYLCTHEERWYEKGIIYKKTYNFFDKVDSSLNQSTKF